MENIQAILSPTQGTTCVCVQVRLDSRSTVRFVDLRAAHESIWRILLGLTSRVPWCRTARMLDSITSLMLPRYSLSSDVLGSAAKRLAELILRVVGHCTHTLRAASVVGIFIAQSSLLLAADLGISKSHRRHQVPKRDLVVRQDGTIADWQVNCQTGLCAVPGIPVLASLNPFRSAVVVRVGPLPRPDRCLSMSAQLT